MNDVNHDSSRLSRIDDADAWDEFVSSQNGHVLQSYAWGQLKSHFGWQAERWAWLLDGKVFAAAQVLLRRLLPGLRVAYIPRGPVSADTSFLEALRASMRRSGVFLLKLEPNWLRGDSRDAMLTGAGFHASHETIQPPATIRIDLTRPLEAILAAMKPKWRYNIRLAEKRGVIVRQGEAADLTTFYDLTRITAQRDRFAVHPLSYYSCAFDLLGAKDAARLFVAEYDGQVLAMIFVTSFGSEAIYLYGASGNEHRSVMPNHALHWAAIQWAKARGCKWYDLWGIPVGRGEVLSPNEAGERTDPERTSQGSPLPDSLTQFKRGFGGEVVHYTGAWDLVFSSPAYRIYRVARALQRRGIGY